MPVVINEDFFPLIIEETEGAMTDEEAVWHRQYVASLLDRKQRYAILYDFRNSAAESQEQRKIDAEFIKANRERLKEYAIGVAFVMPSPLLRIAINVLLFLSPLPMPYTTTKTVGEAALWLEDRFREAGVTFPEAARPYIKDLEIRRVEKSV